MKDYNDIVRLRTKVLILKDELSKATAEIGDIMGKYNNMDYLDEVNAINHEMESLYLDVEDHDNRDDDIQDEIYILLDKKKLFIDSFDIIEKLHNDLQEIIGNVKVCLNKSYEKDMILRSLDEDLMTIFQ
ncbi:MAG: hypothetical protein JXR69_11370 [Candidatus Delongbacteria bacterium]|nr:hypothetical protein [Candidatus Delongbacteria bacterium]